MITFKLNRKAEMREKFSKFLSNVFTYNWDDSLLELDKLEDFLIQHLISRGNGISKNVSEKIRLIKLYLMEPREAEDKKRLILEKVEQLISLLSIPKTGDPLELLRIIYGELRDDWSEFWSRPAEGVVLTITEDLDMIGSLEMDFRKQPSDVYKQFRSILVARGKCYTVLPLMSVIARGQTLGEQHRTTLFEAFNNLFMQMEKLMAPYEFEFIKEEEEEEPAITVRRPRGKIKGTVVTP